MLMERARRRPARAGVRAHARIRIRTCSRSRSRSRPPRTGSHAESPAESRAEGQAGDQAAGEACRRSIPTPALYSAARRDRSDRRRRRRLGAAQYERKLHSPAAARRSPAGVPGRARRTPASSRTRCRPARTTPASSTATLLSVLLPTPSGATALPGSDHVWLTLADRASTCVNQSACLSNELSEGVSRLTQTAWSVTGGELVQITITEYAPGFSDRRPPTSPRTRAAGTARIRWSSPVGTGAQGYSVANLDDTGTSDYMVALHGNLLVEFLVSTTSSPAPDPTYINGLVTQQSARL